MPATYVVFIAGNHDFGLQTEDGKEAAKNLAPNVHYLEDTEIVLEGLRIYGTPWTPHLPGWAFQAEDNTPASSARFQAIPENLDILLSHGPPEGYGDMVSISHVGSQSLRREVERAKPKIVVCGHIHEGYGHYRCDETEIYCVSHMNRNYSPVNKPVEIELV